MPAASTAAAFQPENSLWSISMLILSSNWIPLAYPWGMDLHASGGDPGPSMRTPLMRKLSPSIKNKG